MTGPDPAALARTHARCFAAPPPWPAAAFVGLLGTPGVFLLGEADAFLLGRAIADEAEVLTLAVAPERRRQGRARALLAAFTREAARRGARDAVLEVAEGNAPARALYAAAGWRTAGRRRGYLRDAAGRPADALILAHRLPDVPAGAGKTG